MVGGGLRLDLEAIADFSAFHGKIKPEDDYVRAFASSKFFQNQNMNSENKRFMEPVLKLQSQVRDVQTEIEVILARVSGLLRTMGEVSIQEAKELLNQVEKMLKDCAIKEWRKLDQLVQRAKNMGHRVERDALMVESPQASLIPDPEIFQEHRLYFLAWVEDIVRKSQVLKMDSELKRESFLRRRADIMSRDSQEN